MHIVLGLLGTIVTILILLNRLAEAGIDLGGLNPFLWHRRRKWRKTYEGDPIYKITDPLDMAGLLMVSVAKSDGDMTSEEKKIILQLFQDEFHLNRRQASELMISSVHLLKSGEEFKANLQKVLSPSLKNFTADQAVSTIELVNKVASIEKQDNSIKIELVEQIDHYLRPVLETKQKWAS